MLRLLQHTVDSVRSGVVDFEGQQFVQTFLVTISVVGSIFAFCSGFLAESFYISFLVILGTTLSASLVCIPSWPFYKRHQINWEPHDPKRIARLYAAETQTSLAGAHSKGTSAVAPAKGGSGKKKGGSDNSKKRK